MPTYEYQCKACGHQLEIFQKITDEQLKECPKCHKDALNKLISASNFQLKGTGWYATDFRDKGKVKDKPANTTETKKDSTPSADSKKEQSKATETHKSEKTGDS